MEIENLLMFEKTEFIVMKKKEGGRENRNRQTVKEEERGLKSAQKDV